jgi:hypothetical protein
LCIDRNTIVGGVLPLLHAPCCLQPVDVGHADVQQQQVRAQAGCQHHGLAPVVGLADHLGHRQRRQELPHCREECRIVIGKQYPDRHGSTVDVHAVPAYQAVT